MGMCSVGTAGVVQPKTKQTRISADGKQADFVQKKFNAIEGKLNQQISPEMVTWMLQANGYYLYQDVKRVLAHCDWNLLNFWHEDRNDLWLFSRGPKSLNGWNLYMYIPFKKWRVKMERALEDANKFMFWKDLSFEETAGQSRG